MATQHALIIDDNQSNIDVLAMLLSQEGITHTAFQSMRTLDEGINQLGSVNVVFLDLELPNGDGYNILEHLKANKRLVNVPVVAYTVHTSDFDRAKQAGFHSFISKPLNIRRFPDQLKRILSGTPVWEI